MAVPQRRVELRDRSVPPSSIVSTNVSLTHWHHVPIQVSLSLSMSMGIFFPVLVLMSPRQLKPNYSNTINALC